MHLLHRNCYRTQSMQTAIEHDNAKLSRLIVDRYVVTDMNPIPGRVGKLIRREIDVEVDGSRRLLQVGSGKRRGGHRETASIAIALLLDEDVGRIHSYVEMHNRFRFPRHLDPQGDFSGIEWSAGATAECVLLHLLLWNDRGIGNIGLSALQLDALARRSEPDLAFLVVLAL